MSLESFLFSVAAEYSGERLDRFLATVLPEAAPRPVSRREVRRLITAGSVYADGRRVQVQSRKLRVGTQVEVMLDVGAPRAKPSTFELQKKHVLYEDKDLLALDKPSGLPVQATREDAVQHLFRAAQDYLNRRRGRRGDPPYLALHHRLDRGTSGVVLLAKSKAANPGLARAFSQRQVDKLYLALVHCAESPPTEWAVQDFLASVNSDGKRMTESVYEGGREAETSFRLRQSCAHGLALVEAIPKTGRTHQVRVHLANGRLPVFGDRLYGPTQPTVCAPRLMLHAHRLELEHPINGESLRLESPMPSDFVPWVEEEA